MPTWYSRQVSLVVDCHCNRTCTLVNSSHNGHTSIQLLFSALPRVYCYGLNLRINLHVVSLHFPRDDRWKLFTAGNHLGPSPWFEMTPVLNLASIANGNLTGLQALLLVARPRATTCCRPSRLSVAENNANHVLNCGAHPGRNRYDCGAKLLSGKKMESPNPFSIVGVCERAYTPVTQCGCNAWCFLRFGGWFSARRRVVDGG